MITRIGSIYFSWKGSERKRAIREEQYGDEQGEDVDPDVNNVNNLDAALNFARSFLIRERNCVIVGI